MVIARNTAFTYKGKPVDAKQIGRELGVRYVLEGSVQRSGNQVRINVQLVDAETGAHLWAERFDRDIGDLFAVQNEITARIARALQSQLAIAEARRPTDNPDALDYHAARPCRADAADLEGKQRRGGKAFRDRVGARPAGGRCGGLAGGRADGPRDR